MVGKIPSNSCYKFIRAFKTSSLGLMTGAKSRNKNRKCSVLYSTYKKIPIVEATLLPSLPIQVESEVRRDGSRDLTCKKERLSGG